ncbi:MAG TPA: hypothetical protein PLL95_03210, partial [Anaerolineales bacterium]|nr:hypothetical protein [Anaerolineales bacterium]
MDIRTGVFVLALFAAVGAFLSFRGAIRNMQAARKISFYSLRKRYNNTAWRLVFLAFVLIGVAFWFPSG